MGDYLIDQRKLEDILAFMTKTCTASVAVGGIGIPSVAEEAEELLQRHSGNVAAAAEQAARVEDVSTWRERLPDVLLQLVPILGDSTLLLKSLWRNIRRCALIAHLYGHDLASTETQAMILTCLISSGSNDQPQAGTGEGACGHNSPTGNGGTGGPGSIGAVVRAGVNPNVRLGSRLVAISVSRALLREVFVRATGLKYAGMMYRIGEKAVEPLVQRLRARPPKSVAEKPLAAPPALGSVGASAGGSASSPRGRPAALEGDACGGGAVSSTAPAPSAEGDEKLNAAKVASVMFRPPNAEERTEMLVSLVVVWLLPIIVAALRFAWERLVPLFARRVHMELSVWRYVVMLLTAQLIGFHICLWVKRNVTVFVSVPATVVFVIYALLPGISTFMATRSILQGASEAPFFVLLGVFNLNGGYMRWADDLRSDAELEQRPYPAVAAWRERAQTLRELLWLFLSLDFVAEELLGRVFKLHSMRLLGPKTLFEYRTISFAMGLAAAWAQTRVLELVQRRTVLMRLLGAKQAILAGVSLLFMGISAVSQYKTSVSWLCQVSPSPRMCALVLWIRQWGAIFGAGLPLVMYILLHPHGLGALPPDVLVPIALLVGASVGHAFCWTLDAIWRDKGEDLDSDFRVLYLFPKTNANGRRLASSAMRAAQKRCAEGATSTAVEWVSARIVRKGLDAFMTRGIAAAS